MKKIISVLCISALLISLSVNTIAVEEKTPFDVNAKSAILMDAETGSVLYAKNPHEALPPASVTKIMTLLLVAEAIDGGKMTLDETVSVSDYASSMGGSQVFLKAGEEMSVEDLLKSTVISSANDAAVALCERVSGSEEAFVNSMNAKAEALGMNNTSFENVTGLDDDTKNHVTSAYDIALMSRELITKHPFILNYSSIWMDSIRNGAFGLTNTNRLVRFYKGATGLKTGSTAKAGFCISATAERDDLQLIAVVMGSETRDKRNEAAKCLLDFGFANYEIYKVKGERTGKINVVGGEKESVEGSYNDFEVLIEKSGGEIKKEILTEKSINAPVKKGQKTGSVKLTRDGETLFECDITAENSVEKMTFSKILFGISKKMLLISK